jgi:competence protein ComEC
VTTLLRPLGLFCLAFLAGLLLALRTAPSPEPLCIAAVVVAGLVVTSWKGGFPRGASTPAGIGICFLLTGGAAGAWGARSSVGDCRAAIVDGAVVRATGVLGAGIAPSPPGAAARPPILPLEQAVVSGSNGAACAAAIRIRIDPGASPAAAGSRLVVSGEWVRAGHRVAPDGWPREPYFAGHLAVDSIVAVRRPDPALDPLLAIRGSTESALRTLFPAHGPLTEALLLGRRERLDPDIRDRFARAGIVHLLAISGSHVGLFAAMLLILGGLLRLPRPRVAWLCIAMVAAYLAMIGAPASAVRAGVMISLALLALVLQRPAASIPMMSAAALAILVARPTEVLDVGFQLSFAGVIGILLARRLVLTSVPAWILRKPLVRPLLESVIISAAAFLATAPIVAHHFGQIAPIAIAANLVAGPATAVALAGVIGAVALYPIAEPLARLIADGASVALEVLDRTASIAAAVPLGQMSVARPDWIAWTAALLLALLAWSAVRPLRVQVRRIIAVGAAAAILIAWPAWARGARGALELHFLDVGQGDAVAIRTPADRWLLIDAGPRGRDYDAGARRVLPFFHAHRVDRLEALILTHPDADHIGGAPAVLRGMSVGAVIDPGLAVGKDLYAELLAEVEARGVAWRTARSGHALTLDAVELTFFWPDPGFLDRGGEANEISAVIRVRFGEFEALLTGDASSEVERRLVARHGEQLRSEVLKAGHHGSSTSTSAELLAAVAPELVVITVGRRNRYGHPAPDVVRRIAATGIEIARTDRDGTVSVRVAPGGARWSRLDP